jgi:putative ABC transport system permease protein
VSRLVQQTRIKKSHLVGEPPQPLPTTISGSPLERMLKEFRQRPVSRGMGSSFGANIDSAIDALWANRTRSILTILGIFIGVAAVIAALTLTQGVGAYVDNIIGSGANMIVVYPSATKNGAASQGIGSSSSLTIQDEQTIERTPHIVAATPILATSDQVVYQNQSWSTQIDGVNTQEQTIQNWQLAQGSWFSQQDADNGAPVAVIGDTVYHNLFDASGDNPIGQYIRIRDQVFRVVGVLAPQGGFFTQDDVVFIPFKSAQVRLNNTSTISEVMALADTVNDVNAAQKSVENAIRQNHHLGASASDDFQMFTSQQILQNVSTEETVITALLVGIAGISLTVGGVGIMNIMLVSVTERTWEIGIRMSLGARRSDIRNQFLIESLVLCLVGGVLGLGLGLVVGNLVTHLSSLPFVVTPLTIILPFAVAGSISLLFGLYPAIRASRLDPIVAIRTDE